VDHLQPGEVVGVGAGEEDVHWVENAIADRPSISIHVYGGNIGAIERHTFDPGTSARKRFVSGYTNAAVPNLWDRSAEMV
jgi:predicted metal-dependent enzyme (double-stranded beta helix superfamily)